MKTILSIDDDAEILKCFKLALESHGYRVFATSSFDEFFTILREQPIDLVLLDIRMPGKNGFDVFKEMREYKHLPVLFITAYAGSFALESDSVLEMWQNDFADGETDILYKPFDLKTLYEKVAALIGSDEESQ